MHNVLIILTLLSLSENYLFYRNPFSQAGVFRYGKPELLRLEPRLRVVGRSRTRLHHRSVDREIPLRRIHRRERSFHAVPIWLFAGV